MHDSLSNLRHRLNVTFDSAKRMAVIEEMVHESRASRELINELARLYSVCLSGHCGVSDAVRRSSEDVF